MVAATARGGSVQVLRYSEGQTYKQHMDGMGRMATMLIYLSGMLHPAHRSSLHEHGM